MLKIRIAALSVLTLLAITMGEVSFAGGPELPQSQSGFYISANTGGATFQETQTHTNTFLGGAAVETQFFLDPRNAFNFTWGGGIGWIFNSVFQMDITGTYLHFKLESNDVVISGQVAAPVSSTALFNGSSYVYLINAYVNLVPLFHRMLLHFSPYIGVGIGYARNTFRDFTNGTNTVPSTITRITDNSRSDFAWRIMLGVNYHLLKQLLLNAQYSYLDAGEYEMGNGVSSGGATGVLTQVGTFRIRSNTFTIGLTYIFYI